MNDDRECGKARENCDHKCKRACFEACGDCNIRVDKTIPSCGHVQPVQCYLDPEEFRCRVWLHLELDCGHVHDMMCHEWTDFKCSEKVTVQFDCGHDLEDVECHLKDLVECEAPCAFVLECGHECSAQCVDCQESGKHASKCAHSCERQLICGHTCDRTHGCGNTCKPCEEICWNRCQHNRCDHICGNACVPCREPCEWKCEHYSCSRECSEPCDRPPCNAPCTKTFEPCGHACWGVCGEVCVHAPVECEFYDMEHLEVYDDDVMARNFMDLLDEEKHGRYFELPDCQHMFEVSAIDRWVSQFENASVVGYPTCPACQVSIRRAPRYGSIINGVIKTIEEVKDKIRMKVIQDIANVVSAAENLGKGHWFRCPNGHLYVIGECGGAMEKSKCPDCSADIGGSRHKLLGSNQFAGEVDDSAAPAWPGMGQ